MGATGLGHVRPGGPVGVLLAEPGLSVLKVSVGPKDNNAYLLAGATASLLIDAADDPDRLLQLLATALPGSGQLPAPPYAIVTTHQHADHWQALAALVDASGAVPYAGAPDCAAIERGTGVACRPLWTGDRLSLDPRRQPAEQPRPGPFEGTPPAPGEPGEWSNRTLEIIGLAGHTPGSIALALTAADGVVHLFTGDSLFPGGPGKTRSQRDFEMLMNDLESKVFARFGDASVVHPGHGDDTTLGAERPNLARWWSRGW